MPVTLHELIYRAAAEQGDAIAVRCGQQSLSYRDLLANAQRVANGLLAAGLAAGDRVAICLPKKMETVEAIFGVSCAGGAFVPINPVLKPGQVRFLLANSGAAVLVTNHTRWQQLAPLVGENDHLQSVVLIDDGADTANRGQAAGGKPATIRWPEFTSAKPAEGHRRIDADLAAILYTSGSTGNPKGVMLSHRNLLAGAESVASYLELSPQDHILALLPFSFDAGLSQLTTAFHAGASVQLMDYLLPQDVIRTLAREAISGLTAVPPLWQQLLQQAWPESIAGSLRFIANTGGKMPVPTTQALRQRLPHTDIYLMYGLTEAFRSTFLPPCALDARPDSIGKAIPNAEILVINDKGAPCGPNEPGELVHRGALVSMGYWNDPAATAERFRPLPRQHFAAPIEELAVWSGDRVRRDAEGYLYFIGREDDMIKTSGYRVSPTEIEDVAHAHGDVAQAVAVGLPHEQLGQAILLLVTLGASAKAESGKSSAALGAIVAHCRRELPNFMQPQHTLLCEDLPLNAHGKIDRRQLRESYREFFAGTTTEASA